MSGIPVSWFAIKSLDGTNFGGNVYFLRREPREKPSESDWDQPITAHVRAQDRTQVAVVGGEDDAQWVPTWTDFLRIKYMKLHTFFTCLQLFWALLFFFSFFFCKCKWTNKWTELVYTHEEEVAELSIVAVDHCSPWPGLPIPQKWNNSKCNLGNVAVVWKILCETKPI